MKVSNKERGRDSMKRQKIEKDEMEKATNVNRKKGCNDR